MEYIGPHLKYRMLTRTFLLAWYTAMMTRIDNAGLQIKKGFHESHQKNDHTPVTDADLASHTILTKGWAQTAIVSEETFTPEQGHESLVTWVDPLDATQEYTEGLTQYVSVMACLTQDGQPKAGIVHFPFRNETWSVIDGEWLERPAMSFQPPDTVLVSRSHAGDVKKVLTGYEVDPAGGSGYKAAEVLKGNALAYVHTTKIKTWDICAADAMLRAANASFVEWTTGRPFNYTTNVHTNGLFASTIMSREWFRIAMTVRAPWAQLMIVMVAWVGIYLYPDGTLEKVTRKKNNPIAFAKCAGALLASYITWGIAQERIMTQDYDGQRFQWPAVLVFVNRLVASTFASYFVSQQTTPFFKFSVASFTNVVSSLCQYTALQYTVFPVVVVFKSLKMIPVLIVGRVFFKKKYNYKAYVLALALAAGVALCLFSRVKTYNDEFLMTGVVLLLGYVFFDAMTSQWQSHIFKTFSTPPLEMMYGINTCSVIFTGILIFLTGQLDASINFVMQHPTFLLHLAGLCLPAVIGQWFIFKTIEHHGAAAFAMVMTARQAFSLIASCIIFGHHFDWIAIVGFVVVIAVLFIKTRVSITSNSGYQKVPQTDPEKGLDAEAYDYELDDYELESDHED